MQGGREKRVREKRCVLKSLSRNFKFGALGPSDAIARAGWQHERRVSERISNSAAMDVHVCVSPELEN